jgi:hypothetical protein
MRSGAALPILVALLAGLSMLTALASGIASNVLQRRLRRQLRSKYPDIWADLCATGGNFFRTDPTLPQIMKRIRSEQLDPQTHRIGEWSDRLQNVMLIAVIILAGIAFGLRYVRK